MVQSLMVHGGKLEMMVQDERVPWWNGTLNGTPVDPFDAMEANSYNGLGKVHYFLQPPSFLRV